MPGLTLPSFAKINLLLKVTGKRRDGFHSLYTVFQTVDLSDQLTFDLSPASSFHLALDVGASNIPADSSNLIYKACHEFHQLYPLNNKIRVRIDKRIPVQSGLGGGSSNAACTLIALSRLTGWPLSRKQLLAIARKIGSDVPFFLYGGTALGTARGDRIQKLDDWEGAPLLLVHPDVNCSTAEIYRIYDESHLLTSKTNFIKIPVDRRPESLKDFVFRIENDLEQVVFTLYPELDSIKKRLITNGAATAALTGSGSTLFAFFESDVDLEAASRLFPFCTRARFISRSQYGFALGLEGS